MSFALIHSRASFGINAPLVTVEVHLSNGLPSMSIVGLASAEVKESKERVRSALLNSEFEFPARRIIINLGPADLPKSGGRFDLAIALGLLIASEQLDQECLNNIEVLGELSLNGELRAVSGVLTATLAAKAKNKSILLPKINAEEGALAGKDNILSASNLLEVTRGLSNKKQMAYSPTTVNTETNKQLFDIDEIKGNQHAKRALLIAASAGHNILFTGSPGSGKTMLARCLPDILNKMSLSESMEIAAIESIAKEGFSIEQLSRRRIRSPHHNCSVASITGGGRIPVPGEISLAHRGVLFLDELPEFPRSVLEGLRQPLEDGYLTVSRTEWKVNFPADFQLVAAMNPCPCGYFASEDRECLCSSQKVLQYLSKISGPLLDRIDLQVMVNNPKISLLDEQIKHKENTQQYKRIVGKCRELQIQRQGMLNSRLKAETLLEHSILNKQSKKVFNEAIKFHQFSLRSQQKVLRVARTIADLAEQREITDQAILEAVSYRAFNQLIIKARKFI